MQKKAALTKSISRQDLFNSQDRKGSWNKMSSLYMNPKAEVDDSCESCYQDVLAAAGKCYKEADWAQCIIDTVKGDCVGENTLKLGNNTPLEYLSTLKENSYIVHLFISLGGRP